MRSSKLVLAGGILTLGAACGGPAAPATPPEITARLARYATVPLTADLTTLTDAERRMLPILIEAAQAMDRPFAREAYGNLDSLLAAAPDTGTRHLMEINAGPWDRMAGDEPFLAGVDLKPLGAQFYPLDLLREEFERYIADHPDQSAPLQSLYTLVRRDPSRALAAVPYHEAFQEDHAAAAAKLRQAAALAESAGLRTYLELRAQALETDDYQASDLAWMDMKDNRLDIVIGPIEVYEDKLFGYKAAHEAYVLIKDRDWSGRLARYVGLLPELQRGLPVPPAYKRERPGAGADLNAYDVVYYAGRGKAGIKTIAINLPNDEQVQIQKGTRRLQLKNAVQAKFDRILVPLVGELIAADQRQYVTFDAFFENVMLHEVAHGLGIKNTINRKGTVREALKEHYSAVEEEKADVLGLHMVAALRDRGELAQGLLEDNYVTFLASIFRSVRFGTGDAHGRANMVTLSFLRERGAFTRDSAGAYRVDFAAMRTAIAELAGMLLTIQGNGDHAAAGELLAARGVVPDEVRAALERADAKGIPVDLVFEQGMEVLTGAAGRR